MADKKARSRERLAERYYGKKAILASWEEHRVYSSARLLRLAPEPDPDYLQDLFRRVRAHQNDLAYRGADVFTELIFGSLDNANPTTTP